MKIAIVGGGLSGTLVAVQLLRNFKERSGNCLVIDLYERSEKRSRGVAYSTSSEAHFLNVPASKMSALQDEPDHFSKWLQSRGHDPVQKPFAQRKIYGKYLEELLDESIKNAARSAAFSQTLKEIHSLSEGDFDEYDRVVLATGHYPPRDVPVRSGSEFYSGPQYFRDPWRDLGKLSSLAKDAPVLLIGTGLTMVDIALSLQERGHRGQVYALSRHGYLPQVHRTGDRSPVTLPKSFASGDAKPLEILSWFRSLGESWREGFDLLRPHIQTVWKKLPERERAQFLRHCRAFWDIHRHRMAPEVGEAVKKIIAEDRLRLLAGRITGFTHPTSSEVCVAYSPRGKAGTENTLNVGYVINCTGPNNDYSRVDSPLISDLLQNHGVSIHPMRLGLKTAIDGALMDEQGRPSQSLYGLGPMRQGDLWESVAVPELRDQARALALLLLNS